MKADFVNPFLLSLLNVLSTMAQLELKPANRNARWMSWRAATSPA